jgi:hypothetical protein
VILPPLVESHREGFLVIEAAQKRWPVYALERELA